LSNEDIDSAREFLAHIRSENKRDPYANYALINRILDAADTLAAALAGTQEALDRETHKLHEQVDALAAALAAATAENERLADGLFSVVHRLDSYSAADVDDGFQAAIGEMYEFACAALASRVPQPCETDKFSSRVCELGTKGCDVAHINKETKHE
jgi:hypothetical protein